jgi:hypothetical protein
MGVWLVGDAGTSAADLAAAGPANLARLSGSGTPRPGDTSPVMVLPEELRPFTATAVGGAVAGRYLAVGVAPEGCRLATRDATHPQTWHDEDTGDYVVRTDALGIDLSTYVKVTCEGVVRYQAPITDNARIELAGAVPTLPQVEAAMAGARGTPPDREAVRSTLVSMAGPGQSPRYDDCRVLFNGTVPGSVGSSPIPGGVLREPPVLAVACTTSHGNTQFEVAVDGGAATGGFSRVRLGDPHGVFAVRDVVLQDISTTRSDGTTTHGGASMAGDRVLVLAPPAATGLQVLEAGRVTRSIPLTDGVGAITVPASAAVQVRAVDASGAVVGTGEAPNNGNIPEELPPVQDPVMDNWS